MEGIFKLLLQVNLNISFHDDIRTISEDEEVITNGWKVVKTQLKQIKNHAKNNQGCKRQKWQQTRHTLLTFSDYCVNNKLLKSHTQHTHQT